MALDLEEDVGTDDPTKPITATPAEIAAARQRLGLPAESTPDPTTPTFATPAEVEQAKRRIAARGVVATGVRDLESLGAGIGGGLMRGVASITSATAPLLRKYQDATIGGMHLPGSDYAGLAAGAADKVAEGATSIDARTVADRQALKEEARKDDALHRLHLPLPFTGGKGIDLTDVGTSGGVGDLAGSAVPYVAAGAMAPEVAAPGFLARLGRLGPALTRGAVQSAAVAPVVAAQARTPAGSSLGGLAALTGSEALRHASENPVLRYGAEGALDLLANVGGEVAHTALAGRGAKSAAKAVADAAPTAPSLVDRLPDVPSLWERKPPTPKTPADRAALVAVEQTALEDTSPAAGKLQVTTFSDGSKIPTRYRVVDRGDIAPSHNAFTFQPDPAATPGIQGRSYDADPGAQAAIARGALEFDSDRALNPASSPEEGPPIVTATPNANGKRDVVSGNARVLMLDRATAQRPDRVAAYRADLMQRAGEFGVDPAVVSSMKDPMLVRELVDPDGELHNPAVLSKLNNLSDRPATKIKSRGDEAATRAKDLAAAPDALSHFAATFDPESSLADYLGSAPGKEFFGKLIEGGVIAPEEARGYLNQRGELDDLGRTKLQDVLRASVLEDPRIAERGGAAVRKLDSSLPALALTKQTPPAWEITPTVRNAVQLLQESHAAGMRRVADLAGQGDLLGRGIDPAVLAMAETIESTPAAQLRDRFRTYATAAQEAGVRAQSGDLFPEMAATPEALRARLFGVQAGDSPAVTASLTESGTPLSTSGSQALGAESQVPLSGSHTSTSVSSPPGDGTALSMAELPGTRTGVSSGGPDIGASEGGVPALSPDDANLSAAAADRQQLLDRVLRGEHGKVNPRLAQALRDLDYARRDPATLDEAGHQANIEAAMKLPGTTNVARAIVRNFAAPLEQPELMHAGVTRPMVSSAAGVVKQNLPGAAIGSAIGAATADPDQGESRVGRGVAGGLLGILAQHGARAALRKFEGGSEGEYPAKPVDLSARVADLGQSPPAGAPGPLVATEPPIAPRQPAAPSVTAKVDALGGKSARDYFNVPRLDLPPELQDEVANRVTALAPSAQGVPKRVVSNEETKAAAARLLGVKTPDELAGINWHRMSGVEGTAIASLVGERTRQIGELVEQLRDPSLSPAVRDRLGGQVTQLDTEANQLLRTVMQGASEQGRNLQANKILANLRSPEAALINAQRFLGDRVLTPEEKATLFTKVNAGDETAAADYIASLRKASTPEQLVVLKNAGLLTSPHNRAMYVLGSGINLFLEQAVSKPVSVLTDYLLSTGLGTGQRTKFSGNTGIYTAQIRRGLRESLTRAFDMAGLGELTKGGLPSSGAALQERLGAWAAKLRASDLTPEQLRQFGIPRQTTIDFLPGGAEGKVNRALDTYAKGAFKVTAALDGFIGPIAYRGAMVDAAESLAKAEGTPPARFAARVQELVNAPTDEMIATAKLERDRLTFQNGEFVAKFATAFKNLPAKFVNGQGQKDAANAMMNFLFPFVRTGGNLAARVADYAGVAGIRAVVGYSALRKAVEEGADGMVIRRLQREVATLTGRAATGALATYGVGTWLYHKGLLTGAYPTAGGEREQWRLEGKQANSLLIGDEWVPIARLTPLGGAMAAGANLASAIEHGAQQTPSERAIAAVGGTMRTSLDNPILTGTQSLLEAAQDPSQFGERLLQSQAGSLVPTAAADLAKVTDHGTARRPQGAVEAIEERIPGLRSTLPARISSLGDETRGREGVFDTYLNPISGPHDTSDDPVVQLLKTTGARVSGPKREGPEPDASYRARVAQGDTRPQFAGEKSGAFEARQRAEGQAIRAALQQLIDGGALAGITDPDEKKRAIEDAVLQARRDVRDQLVDQGLIFRKEP